MKSYTNSMYGVLKIALAFLIFHTSSALAVEEPSSPVAESSASTNLDSISSPSKTSASSQGSDKIISGDKSFIGDPDPLDILERKKRQTVILDNSEPVFEDISELLEDKSSKEELKKKQNENKMSEPESSSISSSPSAIIQTTPSEVESSTQQPNAPAKGEENTIISNPNTEQSSNLTAEPMETTPPAQKLETVDLSPQKVPSQKLKNKKLVVPPQPKNPYAISGDDPDFKKEEAFNKIYRRYNSKPTSDETWGELTANRRSMTYIVQKGDNLFEISETLFGDPSYWPKVWSLNSDQVYNPHIIRPNLNIKFYPGDGNNAPSIAFSPIDQELEKEIQKGLKPGETRSPLIQVKIEEEQIPPNTKQTPNLPGLPNHFKSVTVPGANGGQVKNVISLDTLKGKEVQNSPIFIPFSIFEKPIQMQGKIIEGPDGANIVSDYQDCLVELTNGSVGQEYYATASQALKSDFLNEKFKDQIYVYENLGALKIVSIVDANKKIFRARVSKAVGYLTVGSLLIEGKLPTYNSRNTASVNGSSITVGASIVSGLNVKMTEMSSEYSYVLINSGSSSGLTNNLQLKVFPNLTIRSQNLNVEKSDVPIGLVRIIEMTERFSIGVVTKSTQAILVGDIIQ